MLTDQILLTPHRDGAEPGPNLATTAWTPENMRSLQNPVGRAGQIGQTTGYLDLTSPYGPGIADGEAAIHSRLASSALQTAAGIADGEAALQSKLPGGALETAAGIAAGEAQLLGPAGGIGAQSFRSSNEIDPFPPHTPSDQVTREDVSGAIARTADRPVDVSKRGPNNGPNDGPISLWTPQSSPGGGSGELPPLVTGGAPQGSYPGMNDQVADQRLRKLSSP